MVIEASISTSGMLESAVWIDGSRLSRRQAPLPPEVTTVWTAALGSPGQDAKRHLTDAGRTLANALLDHAGQASLSSALKRLPPGDAAAVVLVASGQALALPVELILSSRRWRKVGPLGLLPAVSVSRRVVSRGHVPGARQGLSAVSVPTGVAGPLKILAAVAAPDKTKWPDMPLHVEAEMQAILERRRRDDGRGECTGADPGGGVAIGDPSGPSRRCIPRAALVRPRLIRRCGVGG